MHEWICRSKSNRRMLRDFTAGWAQRSMLVSNSLTLACDINKLHSVFFAYCFHPVNYVLRGGELFNMVLLVPDDMPAGASTLQGNVEEMRALYKDWDPRYRSSWNHTFGCFSVLNGRNRIPKLLNMCEFVYKWRLCIREGMENWSHPSGDFTLLGDAVHATLPYLASG